MNFHEFGGIERLAFREIGGIWRFFRNPRIAASNIPKAAGSAFNTGESIGMQAIVLPNLPAGTYTALEIDGEVCVPRFHNVAWELAGKAGADQFYGSCDINATGTIIGISNDIFRNI